MLKKTAAFGSLLTVLCASSTLAHGPNFKSGFLAGAHVGYSFGSGKFNNTLTQTNPGVVALLVNPASTVSSSASKSGPLFGVFGGYRQLFNQNYTLGVILEANILGSNEFSKQATHTFTTVGGVVVPLSVTNRMKRTFNVIPSVSVGKVFCDRYHVSLGLGVAIARFKQQVTFPVASRGSAQTKIGIVPSIGVEYAATKNVSIVGNFSYEIYKKINKIYNDLPGGIVYASSVKPRYATLKIGAAYRF